ncbi:MAG: type II CAAX endopeptidase family protein [Anaerolineales bacterium]|jgi:membrane protease YdiL (CAAX protease family)
MNRNIHNVAAKGFSLKKFLIFVLIAFGWSWFWWFLFIAGIFEMPAETGTPDFDLLKAGPVILIVLISPFGPTIGGFVVTALSERKEGVKRLWKRFWKSGLSTKWLLITLCFYPIMLLVIRYSAQVFAGTPQAPFPYLRQPWMLLPPFMASILHGGLSEEFGWRGFALPHLQSKMNALSAALVLGLIEGCWHIPLIYMPGDSRAGMGILALVLPYLIVGISRSWIFNSTNGSVLAAVLFHASGNTFGWFIPVNVPFPNYYYLIYLVFALLILVVYGPNSLRRAEKQVKVKIENLSLVSEGDNQI